MRNKRSLNNISIGEIIEIPCISDERGSLSVADRGCIPFDIKRVFWIYEVGEGMCRGGHAHKTCAEVVFPVSGSFDIFVDDGTNQATYKMNSPNQGILIPANVWCCLSNFEVGTVCVVFASQEYLPEGYINSYEVFKQSFR